MLNASMLLDPASSRGALVRAAIVAVLLLLVLAMMLRSDEVPIADAQPQAAAEGTPPLSPVEPVPPSSAEVFPVVTPEPESGPVPEAKPADPPAPAPVAKPTPTPTPPPPLVLQPRPAPVTVATDPVVRVIPPGSAALADATPRPAPEHKPATSAPAAQPAPAAASAGPSANHSLLLRDFVLLEAARTLREAAEAAGYPTRMLHRVVLGPFPSRAEADAARKRNAKLSAIVVAGQSAAEWWVQAGVFADGSNAEALGSRLAQGKDPVQVQGRVTAGPYAGRPVAEQVLAALRSALGQPLAEARVIPTR